MNIKTRIYEFVKEHHLAVISTVNGQALPEASVVGIFVKKLEHEDFEIHIATYDSSRKAFNIKRNPRVALVIGWEHGKTVQIEGVAEEITGLDEKDKVKWEEYPHMPTLAKHIKQEHAVMLKITPKWVKYSNLSTEPWEIEELAYG